MANLRKYDLNLLVIFQALITEKSVTNAAETLGLTQSAVSHALKRLRDQFGDPLFIREGKILTATQFTQTITQNLKDILDQSETLLNFEKEGFSPETATKTFTIGMPDYISEPYAIKLIEDISKQAPNISLSIIHADYQDIKSLLHTEHIQVAIGEIDFLPKAYAIDILFSGKACVYASPHYPYPDSDQLSKEDYTKADHLKRSPTGPKRGFMHDRLHRLGIERKIKFSVPSYALAKALFKKHSLLITGADYMHDFFVKDTGAYALDTDFEMPNYLVSMAWHRKNDLDPAHQWIRKKIQSIIKKVAP